MSQLFLALWFTWAIGCGGQSRATADDVGTSAPAAGGPNTRPNVIFIVVDTLRADALTLARTPQISALRAKGQSPRVAWAAGTWTLPSVISMFTGAQVRRHGWDFPFPRFMKMDTETYAPAPPMPTVAEVLDAQGYRTVAFFANRMLNQGLGLERGFDAWTHIRDRGMLEKVQAEVRTWGDPGDSNEPPKFVYMHLLGPHHPLRPSKEAARRWGLRPKRIAKTRGVRIERAQQGDATVQDEYRRAYYAVVEDTDQLVGALIEALGPHAKDSLIILTSDHGELLGEHGLVGHEQWVFEPLTRVPMVVVGAPAPLPDTMNNAMIPDLITRSLGIQHTWPVALDDPSALVSQRQGKLALSPDGNIKGIWDPEAFGAGFSSFSIVESVDEEQPLPRQPFPVADARLHMARGAYRARVPGRTLRPVPVGMTDELQQALEALGYMGDEDPTGPAAPDAEAAEDAEDDVGDGANGE